MAEKLKNDLGTLIESLDDLREAVSPLFTGEPALVAVDTETTEVLDDRFTAYGTDTRIAGVSLSFGQVDLYVPIRHRPYDWRRRFDLVPEEWRRRLVQDEGVTAAGAWAFGQDPNVDPGAAFEVLQEVFDAPTTQIVGHNLAGFDASMFDVEGVSLPWDRLHETHFMSVFTDPRPLDAWDDERQEYLHGGHALKHLGEAWLDIPADAQALLEEAKKELQCQDYSMLPLRTVLAPYACMDTRLVLELVKHVESREAWNDPRVRLRYEAERRAARHIFALSRRGLRVDTVLARHLGQEAEEKLAHIVTSTNQAAGRVLPWNNGPQLSEVLYQDMELPTYRGKTDTRKATLKMVRKRLDPADDRRSVIEGILAYRDHFKELTSFFRPLQDFGKDGVVFPIYRQMAATTTRMSASKPNIQQMKKKGDVRRVIIPRDGKLFGFCDYDQVEMRLAAHFTKVLPEAFQRYFTWGCTMAKRGSCKGRPPHGPKDDLEKCKKVVHVGRRAQWVYKPPTLHLYQGFMTDPTFDPHQRMANMAEVDRDTGKTADFALLYGAFWYKLAETLDCSVDEAKRLHSIFWEEAYPELSYAREYIDERLRRHGPPTELSGAGYIKTLKGARIYLDSGYKGLNFLVQRSAREVLIDGFNAVSDFCEKETRGAYFPLGLVHDEIVFEVDEQSHDVEVWRQITRLMAEAGAESKVPLTAGCEISRTSWHKEEREEVKL